MPKYFSIGSDFIDLTILVPAWLRFAIANHPRFSAVLGNLVDFRIAKHPSFVSLTTPAFTYERKPFEPLSNGALSVWLKLRLPRSGPPPKALKFMGEVVRTAEENR